MSRKKPEILTLARLYELRNLVGDYSRGDLVLGPLDLRDLNEVLVLAISARERFQEALVAAAATDPPPSPSQSPP